MSRCIFAYATLGAEAQLRVTGLRLDGLPRPERVAPSGRRVDLFREGPTWHRAELELELTADGAAISEFEGRHGELSAIVVTRCARTRARQSTRLTRLRRNGASWRGTIDLDRDNHVGQVLLQPRLAATTDRGRHRVVAEPDGWAIYLDEPNFLPLDGRLQVRWVDFHVESAGPLARQFPDATHLVAFGAGDEPPEVWLNSSVDGLETLLRDASALGTGRLLRSDIARDVWLQLLGVAMAAIRVEEGSGFRAEWPGAEWQRDVLRQVLPRVAPGRPLAELLDMAANEWRSHPGACEFQARAGATIGEIVRANEAVRRLIRASEGAS